MADGQHGQSLAPGNQRKQYQMTTGNELLTALPAWKALEAHHQEVRGLHLRKLFAEDARRGERMTAEAVGIFVDYSKDRVTGETLELLVQHQHRHRRLGPGAGDGL